MLLDYTHHPFFVAASVAVALMAAFTGLFLTRGASKRPSGQRKVAISMAAVALGGGIWSMHFVAMLGLQLPILFYYDALITLISALLAVLMAGLALLILHFARRTAATLTAAGAIVGLGIASMHFVGMSGMQLCRPVNSAADYLLSALVAVGLAVPAIWIAYGQRTHRNLLLGTCALAVSVVGLHYGAIAMTGFAQTEAATASGPLLSNQSLALGVTVAVFLICGAFLLTAVTFLEQVTPAPSKAAPMPDALPDPAPVAAGIPFQREGRTQFATADEVAALRAEGHYTLLYTAREKLFCPWSITEAAQRLTSQGFVRVHRSYLVNPAQVSGFERQKDTGVLFFDGAESLGKVPVSRSRLAAVREALGL